MTDDAVGSGRPEVDAALVLLAKLGVSVADLDRATAANRPVVPTFEEFVPRVSQAVNPGTLRAYSSYWARIVERWPSRRLTEPTPLEIAALGKQLRADRVVRRNGRGGAGAEENFVAAIRCLYRHAVNEGLISEAENVTLKVPKPRRTPSTRRALPDERLAELSRVAGTTGDDPALDSLLLRFHTETACRRGGALNLRRCDLDIEQCLVLLREKGVTNRWQPVSPTMMRHLVAHWDERAGDRPAIEQVLRYRDGKQITYRRYDGLWVRIGRELPWVAVQCVSAHWVRHTVLTWVERSFGYPVARAFAGHSEKGNGDIGSTAVYTRADIAEVAAAVSTLTGESHPLASAQ
jgi:integrase